MIYIGYNYKAKYVTYHDFGIFFSVYDKQSGLWLQMLTESDVHENDWITLESVEGFITKKYRGVNQTIPKVLVYRVNE